MAISPSTSKTDRFPHECCASHIIKHHIWKETCWPRSLALARFSHFNKRTNKRTISFRSVGHNISCVVRRTCHIRQVSFISSIRLPAPGPARSARAASQDHHDAADFQCVEKNLGAAPPVRRAKSNDASSIHPSVRSVCRL